MSIKLIVEEYFELNIEKDINTRKSNQAIVISSEIITQYSGLTIDTDRLLEIDNIYSQVTSPTQIPNNQYWKRVLEIEARMLELSPDILQLFDTTNLNKITYDTEDSGHSEMTVTEGVIYVTWMSGTLHSF